MKTVSPVPLVSVVLAVYNGETTLTAALTSIKNQTFSDFEIIIIDDASTDRTPALLQEWQLQWPADRFTVITQEKNYGLTKSLIAGITHAQGKYIARIDADDEWHKDKLSQQIRWIQHHPEYGVIGCWYVNRMQHGQEIVRVPSDDESIRKRLYQQNPFGHSCVLINKKILDAAGGYNPAIRYGQDYELWFRLAAHTKFYNLPEVLCYRDHQGGISFQHQTSQMWQSIRTIHTYIKRYEASRIHYLGLVVPLISILLSYCRRLLYFLRHST